MSSCSPGPIVGRMWGIITVCRTLLTPRGAQSHLKGFSFRPNLRFNRAGILQMSIQVRMRTLWLALAVMSNSARSAGDVHWNRRWLRGNKLYHWNSDNALNLPDVPLVSRGRSSNSLMRPGTVFKACVSSIAALENQKKRLVDTFFKEVNRAHGLRLWSVWVWWRRQNTLLDAWWLQKDPYDNDEGGIPVYGFIVVG